MAPRRLSFPSLNSSLFHSGFLGDAGQWLGTAGGSGRRAWEAGKDRDRFLRIISEATVALSRDCKADS